MSYPEHSICCIGHITHDRIITPRHEVYLPGGTAYYFAHAMHRLDNKNFILVTAVGSEDQNVVDSLRNIGIEVRQMPSRHTVFFENKYGENQNDREQKVLAKADPFTCGYLDGVCADIYHLGTLLADDFSLDVLKYLKTKGIVSVDAQGYLREVRGEDVFAIDWADKMESMRYIDIIKANEKEMETLTGSTDPYEAARILADWGAGEVLLTLGDKGSLIYTDGKYYEIPAYPVDCVVDATGCGDTYMAGYLYKRAANASIEEAGKFAAAMCTLKLGASGPFNGNLEDIDRILYANSKQN